LTVYRDTCLHIGYIYRAYQLLPMTISCCSARYIVGLYIDGDAG